MATKAKKAPARKPAQAKLGAAAALAERSKDASEHEGAAKKPAAFGKADPKKAKPKAAAAKPGAAKSVKAPAAGKGSLAARVTAKVKTAAASLLGRKATR